MSTLKNLLADILEKSEFVSAIDSIKSAKGKSILFGDSIRNLSPEEIERLQQNGNYSQNWSTVFIAEKFDVDKVHNCIFLGDVVIGGLWKFSKEYDGFVSLIGLYNSTIMNSEIGNNAAIRNVECISNYIIKDNVLISNIGQLSCSPPTLFGNGCDIKIAIETGGREVISFADISIPIAEIAAKSRADKELLQEYSQFISHYCKKITFHKGIIEENAVLLNTSVIKNAYVGKSAIINGAALVEDAAILSSENDKTKITTGAYVKKSVLQWGAEVSSMAIVNSSVLTEYSLVEQHGKVSDSIIGPNTHIAKGEVTSSLVGPFVGFHHQALLIAALWPEGKGNIGYGANIGSNHTAKAPDQEIFPGEGTFFGLGVNIKFPANFSKAPYSIIATGVNMLPQKIEFPFSLINSPSELHKGISPAYNEIFPGWVLINNVYALKRNENKFKKRNKAKRNTFVYDTLRPDTIELMRIARERLTNINEKKEIYLSQDIEGLGKNYMLENSRLEGIRSYAFFIQYFGLRGLAKYVRQHINDKDFQMDGGFLRVQTNNELWECERKILLEELSHNNTIINLTLFAEYSEKLANMVLASKKKDDVRGPKIIDDYTSAHIPAEEDPFVQEVCNEFLHIKAEIYKMIEKFK